MELELRYDLEGTGWADVVLGIGDVKAVMTASYLHDSLKQLAAAALALVDGQDEAVVVFMDEPGEHQLHVHRTTADQILLEIRSYDDWASWNLQSDSAFSVVGRGECSCRQFVRAVLSALDGILEKHGEAGYHEIWVEHEFPVEEHQCLRERMRQITTRCT